MKKILLLAFCLLTLPLGAGEKGWYIQGLAGINFMDKLKDEDTEFGDVEVQINPGYAIGVASGYKLRRYLRLEGEFFYRQNSFKKLKVDTVSINLGGKIESVTVMANGIIEIPIKDYATAYVGLGAGHITIWGKMRVAGYEDSFEENKGLAYQGICGIAIPASYKVNVCFEYRYLYRGHELNNHTINLALNRMF